MASFKINQSRLFFSLIKLQISYLKYSLFAEDVGLVNLER